MKRPFYLLAFIVTAAFAYGCFCTAKLVFANKIPGYISCEGFALDTGRVYVIGSATTVNDDTVSLMTEEAAAVMPAKLCVIAYNRQGKDFKLTNSPSIGLPDQRFREPFLPFCSTLNNGTFQRQQFYRPGEIIRESTLITKGIKFNYVYGNTATRVSLTFKRFGKRLVLSIKKDGSGIAYPLERGKVNQFAVAINTADTLQERAVFSFNTPGKLPGVSYITIKPHLLGAECAVSGADMPVKEAGAFFVNGYLFAIHYLYGTTFIACFCCYLFLLALFQLFFMIRYYRASSPIIRSLLSIRLLLNAIACTAVPLFLTAYHLTAGRAWYLVLVLLVNFSFWLPKNIFQHQVFRSKIIPYFLIVFVCALPPVIACFTRNESLFGVIPILHCAKLGILVLFYLLEWPWFKKTRARYYFRAFVALAYALGLSILSGDTGTIIYTFIAVILVELIKSTVRLRSLFAGILIFITFWFVLFAFKPAITADRKIYRIYAPYIYPSARQLAAANEGDKESYTTFFLDLKSIADHDEPQFNELLVPANMLSTMHSDFAFHWSMMLGGLAFILLYLGITVMMMRNLLFILLCATKECRINDTLSFCFPKQRIAEPIRVLIAFTMVSFIFPVLSNILLIPVTGQSIPFLSISVIEPAFILFLLAGLENIFNNPAYYAVKPGIHYSYRQLLTRFRREFTLACGIIIILFCMDGVRGYFLPDSYAWKKMGNPADTVQSRGTGAKWDKAMLVRDANAIDSGGKALNTDQKLLLLNLASRYYTGKPYFQNSAGGGFFRNSRPALLRAMTIDSLWKVHQQRISGADAPFGSVYSFKQFLNGKLVRKVTNSLYATIPADAYSVNADLTAELNLALAGQISLTGKSSNIGSVMVIDNHNGHVLANSLYPIGTSRDANDIYYFIGSLKKMLVAYCAFELDTGYRHIVVNGVTFDNFIRFSDDQYAAFLLRDLLAKHREAFSRLLETDFGLPLASATADAYLDADPPLYEFSRPLDRHNSIFRLAIGQQQPYPLNTVIQWYCRVASGNKLVLNYGDSITCAPLTMDTARLNTFRNIFRGVLTGTAERVGVALSGNGVDENNFICKTGTAESAVHTYNSSSSFIIANRNFTIGIMLSGQIPANDAGLAAKDLFVKMIPTLLKYHILHQRGQHRKTPENPALVTFR